MNLNPQITGNKKNVAAKERYFFCPSEFVLLGMLTNT